MHPLRTLKKHHKASDNLWGVVEYFKITPSCASACYWWHAAGHLDLQRMMILPPSVRKADECMHLILQRWIRAKLCPNLAAGIKFIPQLLQAHALCLCHGAGVHVCQAVVPQCLLAAATGKTNKRRVSHAQKCFQPVVTDAASNGTTPNMSRILETQAPHPVT